ncbi:unnamed protein product [Prunus armeniaca]|uniref:glutathione synthase n=1 Tax=Prunus armeniaca TaxID=36596 RepID=A0A6J5XTR3_PRUAR|nr:unnamed protein product [Prunus armeniaca]
MRNQTAFAVSIINFQNNILAVGSTSKGSGCGGSRSLLNHYGEFLGLDSKRVPNNPAASQFVEALAKAWTEYNDPRAVVMFVVQADERDMGGQAIAVVYFRAGYTLNDYPSESEWRARLLMEQSSAIKCPSISYHLAGTKKIQQELVKPNVLERFTSGFKFHPLSHYYPNRFNTLFLELVARKRMVTVVTTTNPN